MKKALSVLLCFAMVASAAFAEVSDVFSIGSWGRALWDVYDSNGNTAIHQSWGTPAPRLSVGVRGNTDNVSYLFDIFINGDQIGIGDFAGIDVRPFEGTNIPFNMSIFIGQGVWGEARVDAAFGLWNWERMGSVNGTQNDSMEGMLFSDPLGVAGGLSIRLYPIEGLTIGVAASPGYDYADSKSAADVYGNANAYVSYAIPNIGRVRASYDSRYASDQAWKTWGIIQGLFEFTMVDGLYAAVSAKIPTSNDLSQTSSGSYVSGDVYRATLYVNYDFRDILNLPLKVHALFNTKIMETDANTGKQDGFGFQVGLSAEYEVIENVPVWLDLRYANGVYMDKDSSSGNDCWTFGVGASKRWSNAELGLGFAMATNGYGTAHSTDTDTDTTMSSAAHWDRTNRSLVWAIPVKFQYNF